MRINGARGFEETAYSRGDRDVIKTGGNLDGRDWDRVSLFTRLETAQASIDHIGDLRKNRKHSVMSLSLKHSTRRRILNRENLRESPTKEERELPGGRR